MATVDIQDEQRTRTPRGLLWLGLVLTAVSAVAVAVDQATGDALGRHLLEAYPGFDPGALDAVRAGLAGGLYGVAAAGVVLWLVTLWGVRSGGRWVRLFASVALVLGLVVGVAGLTVAEYGGVPILPTWLGVLVLLPCVPGLAAVVQLWRGGAT